MKNRIWSMVLIFFFSVAGFGQRRQAERSTLDDPFAVSAAQGISLDEGLPANRPLHEEKGSGTALTVSLKELQHKIPKAALKEYDKGVQVLANGNFSGARELLRNAAGEYSETHVAASNVLAEIGEDEEAVRHLEAYLRSAQGDDTSKARVEARLAELRR